MKKTLIIFVLGMACAIYLPLYAQQAPKFTGSLLPSVTLHASVPLSKPLLLVNEQETSYNALVLDEAKLEIDTVLKNIVATEKYGDKARDGVILARTKDNVQLVRLEQILNHFQVPSLSRDLQVLINGKLVKPELILADISNIEKIEVTTLDVTSPYRYSWDENEKYLNIVTKK